MIELIAEDLRQEGNPNGKRKKGQEIILSYSSSFFGAASPLRRANTMSYPSFP